MRFDERAEAVGKFFRQHRNDGADQVGGVASRLSLAIEGGVGADVAGNVGDVDADARVAFRGDFVGERVVKIFGVVGVDREDRDLAVIDSAGGVFGGDAVGQGSGFALDVGGETGREIKFFVDAKELRARFVGAPEARGDRAGELFAAVGPVVEFDDDFVANRDFDRGGLNEDRLDETWIVGRHDEGAAGADDITDNGEFIARDDARDAANGFAGAPAGGAGIRANGDGIARQRDAGVVGRNLHRRCVGTCWRVGENDKGGAAGTKLDASVQLAWIDHGGG